MSIAIFSQECTIVPQETCNLKFVNPEVKSKPLRTEWCLDEAQPDLQVLLNKTKRLIDAITFYNGYRQNIDYSKSYSLTLIPRSRDAIASKNVS